MGLEMKMEKLEIRVRLPYYWKQNLRTTEAARKYAKWRMKCHLKSQSAELVQEFQWR
jgi:hypothetical protein